MGAFDHLARLRSDASARYLNHVWTFAEVQSQGMTVFCSICGAEQERASPPAEGAVPPLCRHLLREPGTWWLCRECSVLTLVTEQSFEVPRA